MEDVVKNATTEGVKLLEGQKKITGVLIMKLKTLLHRCTVDYINIVLRYYVREFDEPDYTMEQIDIEIHSRDDFDDFIKKYGNSVVDDWEIESADETHYMYMVFNLKKLVEE